MDRANPTRTSSEAVIIHFKPTLSACFSASLDHAVVPIVALPILDIDGVDERAMPTPERSPMPPSSNRTKVSVFREMNPKPIWRASVFTSGIVNTARTGFVI